ncbi:MAG TPA: 30S ribosomal protein S6 [Candidatus Omnitrophota bacterium]|jgi:small subunit ribosomal protein S6|nr:30S ribosomal protein S6 [Candidatus Omnitrophota bacterium]HSA30698.1 30S ribosomal protein S6 [Candidatus Omnitrophota bacterium]
MNKYELVVIVDATLPQEQKDAVVKEIGEAIQKCDGKVINSQVWVDKHRMSFRMKKCSEGTYYMINYEGNPAKNAELRRALKLNERVLRSLIVA